MSHEKGTISPDRQTISPEDQDSHKKLRMEPNQVLTNRSFWTQVPLVMEKNRHGYQQLGQAIQ